MKKGLLGLTIISAMAVSVSLLISSCEKKFTISDIPVQPQPEVVVTDNVKVNASVSGIVVDENNVPVMGADVSAGGNRTTTNNYGVFRFDNISLSENNGYVKVNMPGYFTAGRSFITTAGRTHKVRIQLLPKTNTGNFAASTGGAITLTGGGKVVMPSDAVTDASGNAYSGSVNVAMCRIDPTSDKFPSQMIGDLRGITNEGYERGLISFGIIGVELTGNNGQPLKMAAGKTAELNFPIPASLITSAPATIDLWHFDEVNGRWKQEGTATKTGNNYVGKVSHFSFWHPQVNIPTVKIDMTLIDQATDTPFNGVGVYIKEPNGLTTYGKSDSAGYITGLVPLNKTLSLEIVGPCNTKVVSKNIGPFTANASLGKLKFTIPKDNFFVFKGRVKDCNNADVTKGSVTLYLSDGNNYVSPVINGTFVFIVVTCPGINALNYSAVPIDDKAQQNGVATVGSTTTIGGTTDIGTLTACGTSTQERVELLINGTPVSFLAPTDSIRTYDSAYLYPSTKPVIEASTRKPSNNDSFAISFLSSTGTTGSLPIGNLYVKKGSDMAQQIVSVNPTVTITELGAVNIGYMAGNFSVVMNFNGTQRTVTGSFRVKRRM